MLYFNNNYGVLLFTNVRHRRWNYVLDNINTIIMIKWYKENWG